MLTPWDPEEEDPSGESGGCQSGAKPQMWPGTIDALDEVQGIQTQKLTAEQRQEKLFEKLDLSGLGSWSPELADFTCSLLAEYHDILSLEQLGCTHSTQHVIKWLKSPMMLHLKSNSDGFLCHWWKKSVHTCKRCWIQAQFTPARACGVMLWYWFERRTGVYVFA